MPRSRFASSLSSPKVDVVIDMGNPFLNHTVDGFIKIGTVAVAKTAVEETYHVVKRGSLSGHNFEHSLTTLHTLKSEDWPQLFVDLVGMLKKMCKDGAYWGTIAGVYVGMEYGAERVRGTRDWKNALIGGALTGALVSAAGNNNRDKIVMDAITGGAVATAAEFLNYVT